MGSNPTQAQCNFSSEELHWVSHGVVGGKCQYFTLSSFKYIHIYIYIYIYIVTRYPVIKMFLFLITEWEEIFFFLAYSPLLYDSATDESPPDTK